MARYIDADKIKKIVADMTEEVSYEWAWTLTALDKAPTENVMPVEWISVKDRLPDENGKYLVAYYSTQFKRYFLDLLYYDARNKDEYFYCAECYKKRVDYWMPLPEPPKKEGAENA